ncbi:carboxymuconolactone decarboxylase family protein [Neorhizobium sp. DAR64861/K0K2]|uniref:carboxymuconolactone decarboxylase family protein n=1 Tax=unclassified Neorhizobium TaxID=2629175 RepID=UPI003D2CFFD5
MFIKTVETDEPTGDIAALYEAEINSMGRVMQATQCWTARPDVLVPVENLLDQTRDGFSLGLLNFRLITFVVAGYVPSSYCSHVYFRSLSATLGREQALAVRKDHRNAGLSDQQVEMLAYAEQIARDASQITLTDIQRLRDVGLTDLNIADIALAASFRTFMSRYFDAVSATVEPEFIDSDPAISAMMAVGRN